MNLMKISISKNKETPLGVLSVLSVCKQAEMFPGIDKLINDFTCDHEQRFLNKNMPKGSYYSRPGVSNIPADTKVKLKIAADVPVRVGFFDEGGPGWRYSQQKALIDAEAQKQMQQYQTPTAPMNLAGRPESTNVIDLRGATPEQMRQHDAQSVAGANRLANRKAVNEVISMVDPNSAPRGPNESESAYLKRFYSAPNNALAKATANVPAPTQLNKNIQWPPAQAQVSYPAAPTPPMSLSDNSKNYVRNRSAPVVPPGAIKITPPGSSMPLNSPAIANQLSSPAPVDSTVASNPLRKGIPPQGAKASPFPGSVGGINIGPQKSAPVIPPLPMGGLKPPSVTAGIPKSGGFSLGVLSMVFRKRSNTAAGAGPIPVTTAKPATVPIAPKLERPKPSPAAPAMKPSTSSVSKPSFKSGAVIDDGQPLYHYCEECRKPSHGARSRNALRVYDVKSAHCRECTPSCKETPWNLYPCVVSKEEAAQLAPYAKQADLIEGGFSGLLDKGQKFLTDQFAPGQFDKAKLNYGFSRLRGKGVIPSVLSAHGQLSPMTKGLTGGGLGMLGGAMLPSGMRGVGMPLMSGLGAAMSVANGPDGFKWQNMLKPDALIAGGVGALGGYLGSKLMGGDEEEEDDEVAPRKSTGGSILPGIATAGLGILGGYGLHSYMNRQTAAPPPAAPPAAPPATTAAAPAPTATKTTGGAPIPPAQPPAAPTAPVIPIGVPGAAPPSSLFSPEQSTAVNIAVPGTALTPSAPAAPTPPAPPAYQPQLPPNLPAMNKLLHENPTAVLATMNKLDPATMTDAQRMSMRNLVGQFNESENMPGPSMFPRLSDMYRAGYAGDKTALQKAQVYQQILGKAQQLGHGRDFGSLGGLEEVDTTVPPNAMKLDTFKIPGLEALGAFGYKDVSSLAEAAANGDPNVPTALHAMGHQGKMRLFNMLRESQHHIVDSEHGLAAVSAAAAHPRAAALYGALQHAGTSQAPTGKAYDPNALANPEAFKALTPEQRLQLVEDMRNPEGIGKALSVLPQEQRQAAIENLANTFSRNAYIRDKEMNLTPVNSYIDPAVQTALAKARGLNSYQPLNTNAWRDLSHQGGNVGSHLSPYKLRETGAYRTPEDIEAQQSGTYPDYSPTKILTSASPETDQHLVDDWSKVLTSNLRMNRSKDDWAVPTMDNKTLGPIMVSLGRMKEYRPDVYNRVVANLQEKYGKIPTNYSHSRRTHEPMYKEEITPDATMQDYNWDENLRDWLSQNNEGLFNAHTARQHSLSGRRQPDIRQLPE